MATHEGVMVGDLHLEKATAFLPSTWDALEPTFTALDNVVEYMRAHGLNHLIFGGDVCDNPFPSQRTMIRFIQWCAKYPWIDIDVILGNHDYSSTENNSLEMTEFLSKLGMLKNLRLHTTAMSIIKFDGVPFCFMPHPHTIAPRTKYPKVNVAHFEFTGAKRDNGHLIKDGHTLPNNQDYWLFGHLHRMQEFSNAFVVGTLDQKNYGEPLPKGFLHFKFKTSKEKLTVRNKWIEVDPPYKLINIKVTCPEDLDAIENKPNHFYRLLIKKGVEVPASVINHPQVMKHEGWRNKEELVQLQEEKLNLQEDNQSRTFSPTHRLKEHLIKEGLSKAQAKLGVKIVKNIVRDTPELSGMFNHG